MADSPVEFYAAWPKLNTKPINKQWEEIRQDTSTMNVLARAMGVDLDLAGVRKNDILARLMQGEQGFFNRFSIYFDPADGSWKLQKNTGTQATPVWTTVLEATEDCIIKDSNGNLISFYGITVKHSDNSAVFRSVDTINFEAENFYVTPNSSPDEVTVNFRGATGSGNGDITNGTPLGGDQAIFSGKSGTNLEFKGVTAGTGISLSSDANQVTINATGGSGGSGFYGITVKHSDDSQAFRGINTLAFNRADGFYVGQNSPNTDEVVVNFSGAQGPQGPQGPAGADGSSNPIGTYTESPSGIEWIVNHALGSSILLWSVFDDANEYIIPEKVDTSDPDTAYFYFNESVTGSVILSSGSPVSGGGGGGFYGITIKHSDDSESFSGINVVGYNPANFYIHQNPDNTDEAYVNFRFTGNEHIPGQLIVDDNISIGTTAPSASMHIHSSGTPAIRFTRDSEPNDMFDIIQSANGTGTITITQGDDGNQVLLDLRTIPANPGSTSDNAFVRMFKNTGSTGNVALLLNDPVVSSSTIETKFSVEGGHSWIHSDAPTSGRRLGIGTITPASILDVNGDMDVRGTSNFHKRASGFYIPWMEDVSGQQPINNDSLTFKSSTGLWTPGPAGFNVSQSTGETHRIDNLIFDRERFYVSPTSDPDELMVNAIPPTPFRSNIWSVNFPQDGDIISGPYINAGIFGHLTFDHINASINAGGGSETAHWTIYAGNKKDGSDKQVVTGEVTSAQTTPAITDSFYINNLSNKFIWLDVAEIVGTVTELFVEAIYTTSGGNG